MLLGEKNADPEVEESLFSGCLKAWALPSSCCLQVRPNSSKLLSGSSYRDVTGTDEQTPSPLCMSGQPRDGDQEGSQSGRRRAALEGGRCGPARTQHTQALLTAHGLDVCARALQRLKDVAFRQCPRCKTRIAV